MAGTTTHNAPTFLVYQKNWRGAVSTGFLVVRPTSLDLLKEDFALVVPGVRPEWAGEDDQKRVMTPGEAVAAGADYLVIGRPITRAPDPVGAARRIIDEMIAATP